MKLKQLKEIIENFRDNPESFETKIIPPEKIFSDVFDGNDVTLDINIKKFEIVDSEVINGDDLRSVHNPTSDPQNDEEYVAGGWELIEEHIRVYGSCSWKWDAMENLKPKHVYSILWYWYVKTNAAITELKKYNFKPAQKTSDIRIIETATAFFNIFFWLGAPKTFGISPKTKISPTPLYNFYSISVSRQAKGEQAAKIFSDNDAIAEDIYYELEDYFEDWKFDNVADIVMAIYEDDNYKYVDHRTGNFEHDDYYWDGLGVDLTKSGASGLPIDSDAGLRPFGIWKLSISQYGTIDLEAKFEKIVYRAYLAGWDNYK